MLRVENWHLLGTKINAYIMFDLSSIPADATVNHAELQVFCWLTWSETSSISVHQVLDDSWREDEITWNNAPSYFLGATDVVVVSYDDIDKEPHYISWNVTTDLQTFILMGKKELMEVLTVWDPTYEIEFTLFESREGENPPRLIVDYTSSAETTPTKTLTTQTTPVTTGPGYTVLTHKIAKTEGDTMIPTNRFLPSDRAAYLYFEVDWRSVEDCEKTRFTQRLFDPEGLMSETSLSLYIEILGAGQAMRSGNLLLFNITDTTKPGTWRVEWYEGDKPLFTEKFDIASTAPPMTTTTPKTTTMVTAPTTPLATTTTETRITTITPVLGPTTILTVIAVVTVGLAIVGIVLLRRRSSRRETKAPI